jgi:hypothetical protein
MQLFGKGDVRRCFGLNFRYIGITSANFLWLPSKKAARQLNLEVKRKKLCQKLCRLCLSIEKKVVIVRFQSIKQQCHQVYQIEHVHYG